MDYKNNNFHKDHIHPAAHYENLPDGIKEEYEWWVYNSIYNLQMLDANENMAKHDKSLLEWVGENTVEDYKETFLANHLIPNVDLSLNNFGEYFEKRKEMLLEKMKNILN